MKRFVVSVTVDGKEVVRRAVYADDARDILSMDIFTGDEMNLFNELQKANIQIEIKE